MSSAASRGEGLNLVKRQRLPEVNADTASAIGEGRTPADVSGYEDWPRMPMGFQAQEDFLALLQGRRHHEAGTVHRDIEERPCQIGSHASKTFMAANLRTFFRGLPGSPAAIGIDGRLAHKNLPEKGSVRMDGEQTVGPLTGSETPSEGDKCSQTKKLEKKCKKRKNTCPLMRADFDCS